MVCKEIDDFIAEKLKWVITLSNGETIYQDDQREGLAEKVAWIRLAKYIAEHNLKILSFKVQFFSHIEDMTDQNAEGYYFSQAVDATAFSAEHSTNHYYIIGPIINNKAYVKRWKVPEIICIGSEVRDVDVNDPRVILHG